MGSAPLAEARNPFACRGDEKRRNASSLVTDKISSDWLAASLCMHCLVIGLP